MSVSNFAPLQRSRPALKNRAACSLLRALNKRNSASQPLSRASTSQDLERASRRTQHDKRPSASLASTNEFPPRDAAAMGQAASAELRTAQATISTLTKDLAAARSTLAATEATVQQAKSEAVVRGAQSVGSQLVDGVIARQALERELEEAKRSARVRAGELERAQLELKKARDDMIKKTGDAKLKALESEPRGARGGDAIDAAQLVRTASQTLLEDESGMEDPVFGRLLLSTPAQRVYRADPRTLWAGTRLWEKQRAFREARAAEIAAYKKKHPEGGWPGVVTVVQDEGVGAVVDGQHRLGAAWLLSKEDSLPEALQGILVDVRPSTSDDDAKKLFAEINLSEPVPLVDLPTEDGASEDLRQRLDQAAEALAQKWPAMFRPSRSCRPPHLNIDLLRDELFRSGCVPDGDLAAWLLAQNDALGARDDQWWASSSVRCRAASKSARANALAKARDAGFYLGLTWDWLAAAE